MDTKTILATLTRAMLASIAGALVHHGVMQSSATDTFIGAGMLLATGAWGLWNGYVKDIAKASLDILRARVMNAAAAAAASPGLAPRAVASLAAHVEATTPSAAPASPVAPLATTGLILAIALLAWAGPAGAQTRLPSASPRANAVGAPCDPLRLIPGCQEQQGTAKGIDDLVSKLDTLALPDFEFALAQAKAAGNEVTQPCWTAWVDLIRARQAASLGPDGQPLPLPDPHIITAIERISELLSILRPDSKISLACVQIANVAGKDVGTVITGILSGGALGLFKLPIVPIP